MTKTAYADRMSAEAFAEMTKDLSPEDREECRIEQVMSPLFDMWLRFESALARRAIDRLDVSDEDAEAAAKRMEDGGTTGGAAFAYLLRRIRAERLLRELGHRASAVWASDPSAPKMLPIQEVHDRYAKLPKGNA